ncbi:MAG: YybH family protein [Acidobacteriaceae bacterium]
MQPTLTRSKLLCFLLIPAFVTLAPRATAQLGSSLDPLSRPAQTTPNLLTQPTVSPGVIQLMKLEARFENDVIAGGGKAFASWFADDGMTLANGKPPVIGREAIAAQATWSPEDYQLIWTPEGDQMSPQGDMGFTWGHYEGRSKEHNGNPIVTTGRYMTIWKKQPDGRWKVALDSSAKAPPAANECCTLPKP